MHHWEEKRKLKELFNNFFGRKIKVEAWSGGLRWGLSQWVRPWWLGDGVDVHHGFGSEEERTNKRERDMKE